MIKKDSKPRLWPVSVFVFTLGALMISFPAYVSKGASEGLLSCINILLPSLFPFLVFSSFIIRSGLAEKLGKHAESFTQAVFRLPGCALPVIVTAMLGGYPVGARGIRILYCDKKLSESQAQRMALFCICAGPGFTVATIGEKLLGNRIFGIFLFLSQIISALAIGFISARFAPRQAKRNISETPQKCSLSFSSALVESVSDASKGIASLCAFVMLFDALLYLLDGIGILSAVADLFSALSFPEDVAVLLPVLFSEISRGIVSFISAPHFSPELLSFFVAFGGLCVHFQIFAAVGNLKMPFLRFYIFRFLHGFSSSLIFHILLYFLPESITDVFIPINPQLQLYTANSIPLTAALLMLCGIFIVFVENNRTANNFPSKKLPVFDKICFLGGVFLLGLWYTVF